MRKKNRLGNESVFLFLLIGLSVVLFLFGLYQFIAFYDEVFD